MPNNYIHIGKTLTRILLLFFYKNLKLIFFLAFKINYFSVILNLLSDYIILNRVYYFLIKISYFFSLQRFDKYRVFSSLYLFNIDYFNHKHFEFFIKFDLKEIPSGFSLENYNLVDSFYSINNLYSINSDQQMSRTRILIYSLIFDIYYMSLFFNTKCDIYYKLFKYHFMRIRTRRFFYRPNYFRFYNFFRVIKKLDKNLKFRHRILYNTFK